MDRVIWDLSAILDRYDDGQRINRLSFSKVRLDQLLQQIKRNKKENESL